jgi:predicted DNA-binding protein
MSSPFRRSRMVSVRLSPEEYARLQSLCSERGLRSLSDLARTAMQRLAENSGEGPLAPEVGDLQSQMRTLSLKMERLSKVLESRVPEMDSF